MALAAFFGRTIILCLHRLKASVVEDQDICCLFVIRRLPFGTRAWTVVRILQISSARTLGGGERHLADLANGLAERGHQVYVALVQASPLRKLLVKIPTQNLITLRLRNALDVKSALQLARFVRQQKIEIVHAHVARDYPLAAFAARCAAAEDAQFIVTRHVLFPLGQLHAFVLARVARVIAVSEAVAHALRAQRLVPADKIQLVSNGIDVDRFDLALPGSNRKAYRLSFRVHAPLVVGMVGELSDIKGQDDFIRAAALIVQRFGNAVEFLIAGEDASIKGKHRQRIEHLIAKLDLGGQVRLIGHLEDVSTMLHALDVFVSASRVEAFGLAIVEAMASGTPVVATATQGACEIIDDGVTGYLVAVSDAEALAASITRLLEHEDERKSMAVAARNSVSEHFSFARMINETEKVYYRALSEH